MLSIQQQPSYPHAEVLEIGSYESRKALLDVNPEGIPGYLKERPQWVLWRLEKRGGERTKVPVDVRTGDRASTTDLMTWAPFDEAYAVYRGPFSPGICGVGFVFCSGDPFVGVDLDKCRNAETGELEPWAETTVAQFLGAYVEASPSGTGVHIIARGKLRGGKRRGPIELYGSERFFTVTGVEI